MLKAYKRKPTQVDAVQWDGSAEQAVKITALGSKMDHYANTNHIEVDGKQMHPHNWLVFYEGSRAIYTAEEFADRFEDLDKPKEVKPKEVKPKVQRVKKK